MKWDDNTQFRLSASDLIRFMACSHATRLDLAYLHGEDLEPVQDREDAVLLQKRGNQHEAAHLDQLEAEGKSVFRIETECVTFEEAARATREALYRGPNAVFQAVLEDGLWGGFADFLERVPVPSGLGPYSYEVADTKLKRKPVPAHVLQLVLYSDLLAGVQGREPDRAHVILGTGDRFSFRLSEYAAYARIARDRLEAFVRTPPRTRPVPCPHCDLCRWRVRCSDEWKAADSLYLVAGITKSQVAKLEMAGIRTMEALAHLGERVPRLADETAGKLKTQGRLQHDRKTGGPRVELRAHVIGKGFDLMPRPATGDLFYDIEGDPFYTEDGTEGLEYLHGVWDGKAFTALWAHDLEAEKTALAALFDRFEERFRRFPAAHVYHYSHYEISALRNLATRHGIGEIRLDRWLRERRFVDLFAIVRGGIFASEPSYSLKDMEAFYGMSREGEITTAGGSIVAYERWRETGDTRILAEIEEYNRIDCISTEGLRDWLLGVRPEGNWLEIGEGESARSEQQQAENTDLAKFLGASGMAEERQRLLYDLGVFHWREAKPQAWSVFDAAGKDFEELSDDLDCLAGLRATGSQYPARQSLDRDYRYPPQETKLREGRRARFASEDGFAEVEVVRLDRASRSISLKMGPSQGRDLPDGLDLLPDFAVHPGMIPGAVRKVIKDQCGPRFNHTAEDLLSRNPPRFRGRSLLPLGRDADTLEGLISAVRAMDRTVLPVQGPPGTGKTYVAARAILALVQDGKRIAVSSNSHEAIRNVLMECDRALREGYSGLGLGDVHFAHKVARGVGLPEEVENAISCVTSNSDPAIFSAHVVGGTAWLFSRGEAEGAFDYLFVDEAGQVPLANLVAMSNAAGNLVLIGDPRQLPQVIQGAHPHPAKLSCLDWILGDGRNVDREHGIFLPESRRMHPDLCAYISVQHYEGRLKSHPSTARQSVDVSDLPASGAWWAPVTHEGRVQVCPEEVTAIRGTIDSVLLGAWTDRHGLSRALRGDDIIVVAPYNAQVNALSDALPGIRVGTVDKFQGQEAPVAIVSMTASSAEETTRGLDFLLSRERLNVAVSRGKGLSLVFASPRLLHTNCSTVEQMRLVNALCALPEIPCRS